MFGHLTEATLTSIELAQRSVDTLLASRVEFLTYSIPLDHSHKRMNVINVINVDVRCGLHLASVV